MLNYILAIRIQTDSESRGVASQGGNWSLEEGSSANSELVTACQLFLPKQEITSSESGNDDG